MEFVTKSIAEWLGSWSDDDSDVLADADSVEIAEDAPSSPEFVTRSVVRELFEQISADVPDEPIGLALARRFDIRDFGVVARVAHHSQTLREAVRAYMRYQELVHPNVAHHEHDPMADTDSLVVSFDGQPHGKSTKEARVAFGFSLALQWVRKLTDSPDATPVAVQFTHANERFKDDYEDYFGAPVSLGGEDNRLTFASTLFDREIKKGEADLRTYLEELAGVRTEQIREVKEQVGDFIGRIWTLVDQSLSQKDVSQTTVAKQLGMSRRTLQRRLDDYGYSYRELLDEIRERKARELLADPDTTIQSIAYELGYSQVSSFHRAFKRWTGQTPAEVRAELLDTSDEG